MTSVKDFRIDEPATDDALGRGTFVFSDRYSVFDWGEMPDHVPGKGASLCVMGAHTFERMEAAGIDTHYRGVVDPESGEPVRLDGVSAPPREMAIDLTQVPDLPEVDGGYDYDAYHRAAGENYLVPLEIVFRNEVPVGSSLRRRASLDEFVPVRPYREWPDFDVELPDPVVEFSTKYEASDRYLDREEAARIAGEADLDALESVAREVDEVVTETAEAAGLTHQDGKIECLYYEGEIRVADVTGTLDENRFTYDDQQVSKEVLRQHHRRTQSEWVEAVETAKEAAKESKEDWKSLCETSPRPLDPGVLETASEMYGAAADAYAGTDLFDAPALPEAVDAVRDL